MRSGAKSKGIELEIADAHTARRPIVVATPKDVSLYREMADLVIEYDSMGDLLEKLGGLELSIQSR